MFEEHGDAFMNILNVMLVNKRRIPFCIIGKLTIVETGENNIDRTSLFVIGIIVAQSCNSIDD